MAEDTRDVLSLTDDEENGDHDDDDYHLSSVKGLLSKWTNYIHGWQDRYIVLKDGTLSYYKSEDETAFGCRGAVSLNKAIITSHEFDDCRFDVSVNDCLWYLRTKDTLERQTWIDALELHKVESGYGSENNLRRHGSMISLTSGASLSTASTSSFKRGHGLKEKLAEMETFRDILCRQVDSLQNYFDACTSAVSQYTVHDVVQDIEDSDDVNCSSSTVNGFIGKGTNTFTEYDGPKGNDIVSILQQHGAHAIDFKGESFTFKATTAGILATMSHCIELMVQREESWKKRLDRELEKRRKLEENYRQLLQERPKQIRVAQSGPDFEEGPHSVINEEEFFDAIDASLDKLDREEEQRLLSRQESIPKPPLTSLDTNHPLYEEVQNKVEEHMERHVPKDPVADQAEWQLFFEEGDMKVFKRDFEENGMIIYPVKVVTRVKNVTGYEMCKYFWDPEFRLEWDSMIDSCTVVDWYSKNTVVTYQTYKRVWPSAQRDNLFWSTMQQVADRPVSGREDSTDSDQTRDDVWIVVNFTTLHPNAVVVPKCVRIRINVSMMCYTIVEPPKPGHQITRDNVSAKLHYYAHVNPGGWAPQNVIKMISRREVSKFVKQFSKYVQDKTVGQPVKI